MNDNTKATLRFVLWLLALIVTGYSILFVHVIPDYFLFIVTAIKEAGWQYIDWTQSIVQVAVVWIVYLFLRATALKPSATANRNGAADF